MVLIFFLEPAGVIIVAPPPHVTWKKGWRDLSLIPAWWSPLTKASTLIPAPSCVVPVSLVAQVLLLITISSTHSHLPIPYLLWTMDTTMAPLTPVIFTTRGDFAARDLLFLKTKACFKTFYHPICWKKSRIRNTHYRYIYVNVNFPSLWMISSFWYVIFLPTKWRLLHCITWFCFFIKWKNLVN